MGEHWTAMRQWEATMGQQWATMTVGETAVGEWGTVGEQWATMNQRSAVGEDRSVGEWGVHQRGGDVTGEVTAVVEVHGSGVLLHISAGLVGAHLWWKIIG